MRFTLLFVLLLAPVANAKTTQLRGTAQGTTYHIKFVAAETAVDAWQLQRDVEELLGQIDLQMSTYRPDSEIMRFNRAKAEEWFPVSRGTAKVVAAARVISEKSDGAMDVTVGPLVRLWHFGPPEKLRGAASKQPFQPPSDDELAEVRKRVGYKLLDVRLDPPALRKQVDGVEADLSSIASGYTIDHLAALVAKRGLKNYMVELGGEVRAAGMREDGTPWRVAVEKPNAKQQQMEVAVPLVDAALATAGGTHKFFEYDGKRYSHIIDPATGRPVEHAMASVTVAADTCLEADGWDTPLEVLGSERGFELAETLGLAAMFISPAANGDAADEVKKTKAWRMRFEDRAKPSD